MEHLKIFPIEAGPVATMGYLVADTQENVSVVIDAPLESAEFFDEVARRQGTPIQGIWLTHTHFDHIGDAAKLQRLTGAPLWVHPLDEYRLAAPNEHTVFPLPFTLEATQADRHFHDGDTLACGAWRFAVLFSPGHTEGGVCFWDAANKVVFVGDTLFAGSVGRTDLPGGDTDTLLESIATRLMALPDETIVLSGHGPATDIGTERRSNPFVAPYLAKLRR